MYEIRHESGDWAEADTVEDALTAALTLADDNGGVGTSQIDRVDSSGRRAIGFIARDGAGWRGWLGGRER